jgi:hypothetical protein
VTHPKGAGFEIEDPRSARRTTRKAFDEGVDEGGSGVPGAPFVLPMRDAPVHLTHGMDCPRCLSGGRDGDERGWVEVNLGLHVSDVVPPGLPEMLALGVTLTPRLTRQGPVTHCSRGCALDDEEWELILAAAFLDVCAGYADRARAARTGGARKTKPRRRSTELNE